MQISRPRLILEEQVSMGVGNGRPTVR